MKHYFTLLCLFGAIVQTNAQDTISNLDGNNIDAVINNTGIFFQNQAEGQPGYEYPKESNNHLIFSSAFWFAGVDSSGQLYCASQLYGSEDFDTGGDRVDLYPGAITIDGTEAPVPAYADLVYSASKEEIENHIDLVGTPGYVIPDNILNWPAHGDPTLGLDYYLAPFVDANGDGNYTPEAGDYPQIRGDHANYLIMNDIAGPHVASGGLAMGLEIHFMFYQYDTPSMANHTFINVKVINRGDIELTDFKVGYFMDGDIGFSEDDYIGCDSTLSLMYIYNGDVNDEGAGIQPGYGTEIPAVGFLALNHDAYSIMFFDRLTPPYDDPNSAADYWNYMNARWKTGEHLNYGGNGNSTSSGIPTNFMFSGNPTTPDEGWSEISESNPVGDRRCVMSSESTPLGYQDIVCFDYAVIASDSGGFLEGVANLYEIAPEVKDFYYANTITSCDATVGLIETPALLEFELFPNPSNGAFTVNKAGEFDLAVYAIDGRLLFNSINNQETLTVNADLAAGTYIVSLRQDGISAQTKIIIR